MAAPNKTLFFRNKTRGTMLASAARVADTFVSRLVGLLKTPSLERGQGLYIAPCSQIHMYGMKYAIDVVFIDRGGNVVGLSENIQPGQISSQFWKAHGCIELPPGTIRDTTTELGDQIESGAATQADGSI